MAKDDTAPDDWPVSPNGSAYPSIPNDEEAHLLSTGQLDFADADEGHDLAAGPPGPSAQRRPKPQWLRWLLLLLLPPSRPPQQYSVRPWLPAVQGLPKRLLDYAAPRTGQRLALLAVFLLAWTACFVPLLLAGRRPITDSAGRDVVSLDCTDTFWHRKNECGLDGVDCAPFADTLLAFRCPGNCASVMLLNPRAVGPQDVVYRPLLVGGSNGSSTAYRGDSWICTAAIHAGIIGNAGGGCGRAELVGERRAYPSVAGAGGLRSIAFDSYFPQSFSVSADDAGGGCGCGGESRGRLLAVSLLFTALLALFASSPALFFAVTLAAGFVHVGLVSDPTPAAFHSRSVLPDQASKLVGRMLPAAFCLVVLYRTCVRRSLAGLDAAPLDRALLWLGGFWFGALSNYTLDWIPIQRLTPHDIAQQPGARAALAVIVVLLALAVAQQAHGFWREGRLLRYLGLYGLLLAALLVAALALPGLSLRIHHYVLALLLLPGTSLQTRPSLLYQGLLLGLFVNGVARWGFASVLETPDALRGDASFDALVPSLAAAPSVVLATAATPSADASFGNITFSWSLPDAAAATASAGMQGISVLVNDVERLRRFSLAAHENFTWTRPAGLDLPEYFRFAFIRDGTTLDYSKAGTWLANGTWLMAP